MVAKIATRYLPLREEADNENGCDRHERYEGYERYERYERYEGSSHGGPVRRSDLPAPERHRGWLLLGFQRAGRKTALAGSWSVSEFASIARLALS
jgi:hypothetical protein